MRLSPLLLKILLIIGLIGGGSYIAQQNGWLPNNSHNSESKLKTEIEQKKAEIEGSIQGVSESVSNQVETLTERGGEVQTHVEAVLGQYVKTNSSSSNSENETQASNQVDQETESDSENQTNSNSSNQSRSEAPIYEETLEYARYLYCQQVVKDYEVNN